MANFCSKCGAEIPVGEGFCPKCGNMVSMNAASVAAAGTQTIYSQGNSGSQVSGETKKRSQIGIVAGILGIAGLLLSILAFGGIFGFAAVILGVIVLARKSEYKIGMAVAGVVTGGIAILVALFMLYGFVWGSSYDDGYAAGRRAGYVDGLDDGLDVPWYVKLFY